MTIHSRTPEQIEQAGKLIERLCVLFHPFVTAACEPIIRAEMTGPPPFTDEQIANIRQNLNEIPDDVPPELKTQLGELADQIGKPFTEEDILQAIREESANECAQLVRNWLNMFFRVEEDEDDSPSRTIDARTLDDSMMPVLSPEDAELYSQCCGQGLLGEPETRVILRQVRATLPAGKLLPDEAVEFLASEHITILS